jgi:hypothetical protein
MKARINKMIVFVSLMQAALGILHIYNGYSDGDNHDYFYAVFLGICSFLTYRFGGYK